MISSVSPELTTTSVDSLHMSAMTVANNSLYAFHPATTLKSWKAIKPSGDTSNVTKTLA